MQILKKILLHFLLLLVLAYKFIGFILAFSNIICSSSCDLSPPPPRQPLWSQHTCFMTTSFLHNFCPVPRQWSRCGSMAHPHSPERQLLGWVHDREHVALSFLSLGYFGSYNNFQTRSFILHIAKYNPTVDIRYIFFHYPSVNGYPGWLYFLAAMNRAAINRVVQTSQWGTQRP